ncbi:MAG TPA: GDSL-type esterase/lipase family protein [Acidimicrobiales bacterium]|jgi:lysophospholipase L1-like esterase
MSHRVAHRLRSARLLQAVWSRARPLLSFAGLVLVIGVASIALSLRVTPAQTVTALGETVEVGAAAPSLSLSGPGELDLFGQSMATRQHFDGPVRPRLVLSHITVNRQLAAVLHTPGSDLRSRLGRQLVNGLTRYFVWESVIVACGATILLGAYAGWRRHRLGQTVKLLVGGLIAMEALNVGCIAIAAFSAPRVLGHISSLDQLVGRAPGGAIPAPAGPPLGGVQAVVMGDSTAAGVGNPLVADPSTLDRACQRSVDSYPALLAEENGWNVLNLACSGATVQQGLLGAQSIGGQVAPPQLAVASQASTASLVVLSVGADDVHWSAIIELCAVSQACDNQAATAYFQSNLAQFTEHYYDLLSDLTALPNHPKVLVNSYYNPFGPDLRCLKDVGLTRAKVNVLDSDLNALDAVLAKGANTFGLVSVKPNFAGHGICSAQPDVQALSAAAPFHPTLAGALTIALADESALAHHRAAPS